MKKVSKANENVLQIIIASFEIVINALAVFSSMPAIFSHTYHMFRFVIVLDFLAIHLRVLFSCCM